MIKYIINNTQFKHNIYIYNFSISGVSITTVRTIQNNANQRPIKIMEKYHLMRIMITNQNEGRYDLKYKNNKK